MFKKALTESGKRILKVIKKLSTRSRAVRKSQQEQKKLYCNEVMYEMSPAVVPGWTATYLEPEYESMSWSLHSLDAKSIDTYVTYVTEGSSECTSICSYCTEYENRRNENIENEMII
ncbi:uncharacterized protein [Fopius arisanus]|uniref:Uncharacterized protein n=1 Tax=Fopius arisanus TaxID=64838 RepID=A0A9R1TUP3_9HYME|nr:PREDICTED: uncharacterized protein LOC105262894 [Fopius arisanus]XP_011297061.1 PREDICTED: uncharacterized protein LOC105262894 [Fopius arisanus]